MKYLALIVMGLALFISPASSQTPTPYEITVVYDSPVLVELEAHGAVDWNTKTLYLKSRGEECPESMVDDAEHWGMSCEEFYEWVYVHEWVHIMLFSMGQDMLSYDETFVDALSRRMLEMNKAHNRRPFTQ